MRASLQNASVKLASGRGIGAPFNLDRQERTVFLVCAAASLAAKASALSCAYSADDFVFITADDPYRFSLGILAANGRLGMALLLSGLNAVGIRQPQATAVGVSLAIVLSSYISVLICRLWRTTSSILPACITACLLTLHPYQIELFTFRVVVLPISIALVLAGLASYYLLETGVRLWFPILLLVVACFIYQTALSFAVVIIATTYLARALLPIRPEAHQALGLAPLWSAVRPIALVVLSAALYFALNAALLSAMAIPTGSRFVLVSLSDVGKRLSELSKLLIKVFVQSEPLYPITVKVLLLLLLMVSIAAIVLRPRPAGSGRFVLVWRLAAALIITPSLAVSCVGVLLFIRDWWPAARTLAQFGIFWAFVFATGIHFALGRNRSVLILGGLFACICFAGLNSWVLTDQHRMNERDKAKITRVTARLESLPSFERMRSLLILGGHWDYPLPIETVYFDMNVSALYASWASTRALNEFTGYRFSTPTSPEDISIAKRYCKAAKPWPALESTIIMNELGIVCLGKEK